MDNQGTTPDHETLGDLFRRLRMERSLDISEVAKETRIPPETIRAMEADDYSMLPAFTFARGFYGLYAKMLGLDHEAVIRRFAEEYPRDDTSPPHEGDQSQEWRGEDIGSMAERPSHSSGSIISFSLLLLVLAAAGISWYAGYNPAIAISNWLRSFQEDTFVVEETVQEQEAPLLQDSGAAGQATEIEQPVQPALPGVNESTYRLVAEFQEPVTVTISIDGGDPEKLNLPAGSIESWLADEHIVLELPPAKASAVRLYLNGILVPLPPAEGDKITVSIPEHYLE